MELEEIGCEDTDWVYLAHDVIRWRAAVTVVTNFRIL
jgi:hypothetical protein